MKGLRPARNRKVEGVKSLRVCIVSFPMPSALVTSQLLTSLVEILEPICDSLYVITANMPKEKISGGKAKLVDVKTSMHFRGSIHPKWWSTLLQVFKILFIQAKMSWALARISRKIDLAMFYVGGANLFPPVLMAKILRKKVIVLETGPGSKIYKKAPAERASDIGYGVLSHVFSLLLRANYFLASQIIVQSKSIVDFLDLSRYKQKLMCGGARYINTELFKVEKELKDRDNSIGYIGRLDIAKGVMNLVNAMPIVSKTREDTDFLIGGSGLLYDQIKQQLKSNDLSHKVKLTGWIPHDELPDYLNQLKLLVLPSYAEGLPTTILEAMACGTPVLATPVGGVPDVIKDGETGFIMENNSPECIARNIIRVLNHPNLEEITRSARALVEREYTYEAAVERYREILDALDTRWQYT